MVATLSKKINMINSAGTQQTALIYSTADESGSPYMRASVDGVDGYVALCDPSDSRATSGRVLQGGGTYAIANASVPAYGYALFTSSGTFTVPAGVTKLKVTCVGAGAGCLNFVCSPDRTECNTLGGADGVVTNYHTSGGGGASSFGSVTAAGAAGNTATYKGTGCDCSAGRDSTRCCCPSTSYTIGAGRNRGTKHAITIAWSGAAGYTVTGVDGTARGTFGAGGGGGGDGNSDTICPITGSSGYVTISTITVNPGDVIAATVGIGGSGFVWWGTYAYSGGNGCVFVEYGNGVS